MLEEVFRGLEDALPLWVSSADRRAVDYASDALAALLGRPREELLRSAAPLIEAAHPEDRARVAAWLDHFDAASAETECRVVRPDGAIAWLSLRLVRLERDGRVVGVAKDVSREKALEEHVRDAQRLDSIGRIAGGLAHDFNNALLVILNQTEMALRVSGGASAAREHLEIVRDAAQQAAQLTHKLLTLARHGEWTSAPVDIDKAVSETAPLVRGLLGDSIRLVLRRRAGGALVRVDGCQLQQVLVNLALNARDVMPSGGKLTIATTLMTVDEHATAAERVASGDYAVIEVTDTGPGIPEAERAHLFEPFFTTKRPGEGTGIGLASCQEIVQRHGGTIDASSPPGAGATFRVVLPRIEGAGQAVTLAPSMMSVLVVDDEARVRALAARILRAAGYDVLEASDGVEALRLVREHEGAVAAVLSDVVMPRMTGIELAQTLGREFRDLPVVLTSGQKKPDGIGALLGCVGWLAKPYDAPALLGSLRCAMATVTAGPTAARSSAR